jgi:pimeloyl-ACP methyl ester carboxylesterase
VRLNHHRVGSGPPLVLIHGIGSRWQMWQPVLERVAAEREVIALDLPGFGASPPPPTGTPPGIASLVRLVSEFIDELGLGRPHVAGNSLGGWLSLELAKHGRARSATGLSPAGFHNRLEGSFQRASLTFARRASGLAAPRAERFLSTPARRKLMLQQYFAHPERISTADAAADLRALAGAAWFTPTLRAINATHFSGGEQIEVPVTIAWGEKDRLLRPRQAARAQRAVPRARLLVLTGCGHVPTYDDPEQVARALLEGSDAG